jgi:hypothetical protein
MFRWIRRTLKKGLGRDDRTAALQGDAPPQAESQEGYSSDQPIASHLQDRFNRAPFARRIAHTIVNRRDPTSIVIGLFGPWGDGKTSVLEMMAEALEEKNSRAMVVRFNPWHFQSEDNLLRGFFATLADSLGQSLPNRKERAGDVLKKYGALLSLGSAGLGQVAKDLGSALSNVGLDDLKRRIDTLLAESGKRLVILIDDIDRLDRDETHTIFKLVKLSANFNHTCYVLAFDEEVVSASLGERYGSGGQEAGRAFLEKIIQVPLHLPPADNVSLRQLAFEGAERALLEAEISLEQGRVDAFVRHFVDGLEPRLQTPRLAKLYANALGFALPLLKGEVDIVDLMLIEGIRVFYPKLYEAIRDQPDLFLRAPGRRRQLRVEEQPLPLEVLLEKALPGMLREDWETVRDRLLERLFPRIGNMEYGGDWERIWAAQQRICSAQYFPRFFTYGVPNGDVPDAQVRSLIEDLPTLTQEAQRELLKGFEARRATPRLIKMLHNRAGNIGQDEAICLAEAIARNADLLPRERGPMVMLDSMRQAGMLIAELLRQVQMERRVEVVENLVQRAEPLRFAMECIRWCQHYPERPEEHRVLPDGSEARLNAILAQRISAANEENPLYLQQPKDAPDLYWLWSTAAGGSQAVRVALEARFLAVPEDVDAFLDTFVGEGWEIDSGLPVRSDFERRNFDSVSELIPSDFIVSNLRQRYGAELNDPQYHLSGEPSTARKFAHQFVFIHVNRERERVEEGVE